MDARQKSFLCAKFARAKKAMDLLILDVRKISSFADYFVICSGRSDRQVQAIAEHLESSLLKERIRPRHVEGLSVGRWVLMDYNDVIVHIFLEPVRRFYDLEGLWSEAIKVDLPPESEEVGATPQKVRGLLGDPREEGP